MNKQEYVAGLRELADFIENAPFPDSWQGAWGEKSWEAHYIYLNTGTKEDFQKFVKALGTFEKTFSEYSSSAVKTLPSGIKITVSTDRQNICKKVVVGTRVIPAKEERTVIEEAEPEREEEIVKWECGSFLGESGE